MQNSRYQKAEKFYEVPVFIAVVLLIPVIIIEYRSSELKEFANYLNWGIWIVFLLEYVHLLILSENRKDYVLTHKLELFIVIGSIPFVPQGLESSRFLRFVRLPRLLRAFQLFRLAVVVAKFGSDIKAIFNSRGLRSIVYATIFLIKSVHKILLKNINNDLKISKEEIPSIINVFVYSIILFFYLVCLFAFGFWPASLLLLWAGILYFRPEKNLNSIMKSLGIALITCLIAYIVFSSGWLFYVPFPKSRIWI